MSTPVKSNSNNQHASEERRFDRRSWVMLALASTALLYSLTLSFYATLLPTDGWEFQFALTQSDPNYRFTEYYGSRPTPLQKDDRLIAIDGKPIERLFAETFALQFTRPAHWQVGNTVAYTIQRDARQLTVAVPLMRLPPSAIGCYVARQLASVLLIVMNLVMIAIGLVVFLQRPRYLPAQLLLLFCWSLTSSQLELAPPSVQVVLDPIVLFFLYIPIFLPIWQLTIFPVLVHLLLVFPVVKQPLRRHPRLILLALYAPGVIGTWLAVGLNLGRPSDMERVTGVVQAFQTVTALILAIASVAHTFRTVHDATVRAQMRWVTVGVVFGFMGSALAWLFLTLLGLSESLYSFLIYPLLLLPLSLAIAILRYRLFDIDFLIRRTLIYGVVSVLLGLIFAGLVVALQTLFRTVTGQQSDVAIAISTLAIAALALPLRNRIQAVIDQRFYRKQYDAQKTLETFVAGLQQQTDLAGLAADTRAVIQETLQPASVKVWLVADRDRSPPVAGEPPAEITPIAPDDPIIVALQRARRAVEVETLRLDSPAGRALRAEGAILAAPLVNQGAFIGLISLGPRLSEQGYSTDDTRLLTNLTTQAAPAFRIAILVREQRQEAEERAQTEQELGIARSIQQTLLRQEQLVLEGWTVEAHYQPARAVGGDFYDFIRLPDGRVSIIIGDVTDKGVPAALVMAMTRTLLRETTKQHDSPGAILAVANESLAGDIPEKMFVTCFYAMLDPATGRMVYANAGHNLPYRRMHDHVEELRARGMPLGLMPDMSYEEAEIFIAPDETVLFYTDGLVEVHNAEREMFGLSRVQALIAQHPGGPELVPYLLEHQLSFTGLDWEQEDDTTMIILQWVPNVSKVVDKERAGLDGT